MRRRVEMRGGGEAQTNESEEGGDRMDDQNRREGLPRAGREIEVVAVLGYLTWGELVSGNTSGEEHEPGAYRILIPVQSFPLQ